MTTAPVEFQLQRVPSDTSKSDTEVVVFQVGHETPQSSNAGNASTGVAPSKDEPNTTHDLEYPDGGLRAWLVVFGVSASRTAGDAIISDLMIALAGVLHIVCNVCGLVYMIATRQLAHGATDLALPTAGVSFSLYTRRTF